MEMGYSGPLLKLSTAFVPLGPLGRSWMRISAMALSLLLPDLYDDQVRGQSDNP